MTIPVVLFSAGVDSAVLLAEAVHQYGTAQPVYVSSGLAWEADERAAADRVISAPSWRARARALVTLSVDMRDVYPASNWAVRGTAPGYDTPDDDVYIDGRNIVLLSKAAVFAARTGSSRLLIGPLAGNPFPDATPAFFQAMSRALSLGLAAGIEVEAPFLEMSKGDVIRRGAALHVPFELTLSCMQPDAGAHCGACSKCRERQEGFKEAGLQDPARYAKAPPR